MTPGEISSTRTTAHNLLAMVTDLLAQPLTDLEDDEFVTELVDMEVVKRLLGALEHRLVNEVSDRSLWMRAGVKHTPAYLMATLRISRADAWGRFRAAERLGDLSHRVGAPTAPVLPHTAEVQAAGEISAEHARAVWNVMRRVPEAIELDTRVKVEEFLAEKARELSPDDIKGVGDRVLGFLDPDGTLTEEKDRKRMREIIICKQRPDGMSEIRGVIDPVLRAILETIFAKWARPGMCNPADAESPTATDGSLDQAQVDAAAKRDARSVGQRNHDALVTFLSAGGGPESLGTHRGLPVSVILTMTAAELEQRTGIATTATGGTLSVPEALALAKETNASPLLAIFDPHGRPLHLGSTRLANPWIRYALIAADRGCTRPGCDAPASMCAVHHVTEWAKDGPTDVENLTFACDSCHSMITDNGWATEILGADSAHPGATGWRPPRLMDPTRTARVNLRHHPERVLSGALRRHLTERARTRHGDRARDRAAEHPLTS